MTERKEIRQPAFPEITRNGRTVFLDWESVLDDPALQAEVVRQAVSELGPWRDRYAEFFPQIGAEDALEMRDVASLRLGIAG